MTADDQELCRLMPTPAYEVIDDVRLSAGHPLHPRDQGLFPHDQHLLRRCFRLQLAPMCSRRRRGKWDDCVADGQHRLAGHAERNALCPRRQGLQIGRLQRPRQYGRESTDYDPENVWSYEAGFKSRIGGQLTLNGAVFHHQLQGFPGARVGDRRRSRDRPPDAQAVGAERRQAADPRRRARGSLDSGRRGLLLDTQIGYLDADYKEFDDVRFTAFGGSRAFQTPAFAPKWTTRLRCAICASTSAGPGASRSARRPATSRRTALAVDNTLTNTDTEIDGLFQKGYWVHDARIVYETEQQAFRSRPLRQQPGDRAYKTDAQEFSSVGGIRTVYYGAPRTVTLRLTARY